ncbi:MAG: hypothetical protein Q4C52_12005 [Eubacteriales bacterium]|nr:hypothetical protein [Eubacteriales bacterium]
MSLTYNSKKASEIHPYLRGITFTECSSENSDKLDISLHDTDKIWLTKWFPKKGDKLGLNIYLKDQWQDKKKKIKIPCGKFTLDDFTIQYGSCDLSALSQPASESFNVTERTKTWKNVTIKGVAQEFGNKYKLKVVYEAISIQIKEIEQNGKTDSAFLTELCKEYGLAYKIYSNQIVIRDFEDYEKKKAVMTIKEKDVSSDWTFNDTLYGIYTGAKISYTNASTKTDVTVMVGSAKRLLNVTQKADDERDAKLKANAKVAESNRKATTMTLTIMANSKIYAGCNVNLSGFAKKIDGKYSVSKVVHSIDASAVYTMKLDLYRIVKK